MKILISFFIFMGVCNAASEKVQKGDRWAEVINEGAAVYKEESFDSETIGYLEKSEKNKKKLYKISHNLYGGAFFRILFSPGVVGYVADTDVRPVESESLDEGSKKKDIKKIDAGADNKKKRPFMYTQYFGLEYANIHFREDTMGLRPSANLGFWGFKMFGPNLFVEGLTVTEMNFLFYPNSPNYYSDATGKPSSGWIFLADALFQMVVPQNKVTVTYFGFGPLFKYSKFDVQSQEAGATFVSRYSLEDIVLGLAFNLGIGLKLNSFALRAEYQFYWEKLNYSGLGLSLQREF